MSAYLPYIEPLLSQENLMVDLLESWVNINSGSDNLEGLTKMADVLEGSFSVLNAQFERIPLPNRKKINSRGTLYETPSGHAISMKKRPEAAFKILLGGHLDTVYSPASAFQTAERLDPEILRGPGTADMKGGLVILLKALETFEKSPFAEKVGWEILINPDEEIGSPSSQYLFKERAAQYQVGLLFEPAFADGSLVNERKGSINYTFIAYGKAAHTGRDYYAGRNAITAMARFVQGIETLNDRHRDITVNVGTFEGGGTPNIVPDRASCKVNIRLQNPKDLPMISASIKALIKGCSSTDGITFESYEETSRPPKLFNKANRLLFELLKNCAEEIGLNIRWQPSGGVCDGNLLSAAGLPTIDTMGAVGGHIHTSDEFIFIPSLVERAKLTACFLMQLAEHHQRKLFYEK